MASQTTKATIDNTSIKVDKHSANSLNRNLSGLPEKFLSGSYERSRISLCENYGVQAKLKIGHVNDKYEQEADRVAEQVMNMPEQAVVQRQVEEKELIQSKSIPNTINPVIQRQQEEEEEVQPEYDQEPEEPTPILDSAPTRDADEMAEEDEEEFVQAKSNISTVPQVTPGLAQNINSLKGSGQLLPTSERVFFEPRFRRDFSDVRVHSDSRAARTAQSINARAFTIGRDVVFGVGQYSPGTSSGRRLLAHELTHTIQQTSKSLVQRSPRQKRNYSRRFKRKKTLELLKKLGFKSYSELATYSIILKKKYSVRVYDWKWRLIIRPYYKILKNDPVWKEILFFHKQYEKFVEKTKRSKFVAFSKVDTRRYEFLTTGLVNPWKIKFRNNFFTIWDPIDVVRFRALNHSELFQALKICVKEAKITGIAKPYKIKIGKAPWTVSEIITAGRKEYKKQFTRTSTLQINTLLLIRSRRMMLYVGLGVHIARYWKSIWGLSQVGGCRGKIYRELSKQLKRKKSPLFTVESVFNKTIGSSNRSISALSTRLANSHLSAKQGKKIILLTANSNKCIYIYDFENKKLYK